MTSMSDRYPDSRPRPALGKVSDRDRRREKLFEKYLSIVTSGVMPETEFRGFKQAVAWRLDEPRAAKLMGAFRTACESLGGLRLDPKWEAKAIAWLDGKAWRLNGHRRVSESIKLGDREALVIRDEPRVYVVDLVKRINPVTGLAVAYDAVYLVRGRALGEFRYQCWDFGRGFRIV